MNFLFLNSAGTWGGNEKWTHMAATSLSEEYPVYLAYKNETIGSRFPMEKIKLPFSFGFDIVTIRAVMKFVRERKIDILIPTKKRDYLVAGIAARACDVKNILRLGIVRKVGHNPYSNWVYNKLAHGIIVNAQIVKDTLLQSPFMQENKIRVIYNGLDTETIDYKSQLNNAPAKPFPFLICTTGRISRRKGIGTILNGFAHFVSRVGKERLGLMIIGSGDRMQDYKQHAVKLGISDNVLFTGFLDNPYPFMKYCDAYLTASTNEGISNSLLEAMYLGLPVITTKAGGTQEFITHEKNGLFVDSENVEMISEALFRLFSDEMLREKLSREARRTVSEKFSLGRMRREIVQFSHEVLER